MNKESKNYFAQNLKHLRTAKHMEQIELAEKLGRKSSSSISAWEKGDYTPKAGILSDIANIFGVNLSELMDKDLTSGYSINIGDSQRIIYGDNNEIGEHSGALSIDNSDNSTYNFGNSDKHNESMKRLNVADLKLQRSLINKIDEQIAVQRETNNKLDLILELLANIMESEM